MQPGLLDANFVASVGQPDVLIVGQLNEFIVEGNLRDISINLDRIGLAQRAGNCEDGVRVAVAGQLLSGAVRQQSADQDRTASTESWPETGSSPPSADGKFALQFLVRRVRTTASRAFWPSDERCPLKSPSGSVPSFRFVDVQVALRDRRPQWAAAAQIKI